MLPSENNSECFVYSACRILAIFVCVLNIVDAIWQEIILTSSLLVTAISISAVSPPADFRVFGWEAFPSITLRSHLDESFSSRSPSMSTTVTSLSCSLASSTAEADPTRPAPSIRIFITLRGSFYMIFRFA